MLCFAQERVKVPPWVHVLGLSRSWDFRPRHTSTWNLFAIGITSLLTLFVGTWSLFGGLCPLLLWRGWNKISFKGWFMCQGVMIACSFWFYSEDTSVAVWSTLSLEGASVHKQTRPVERRQLAHTAIKCAMSDALHCILALLSVEGCVCAGRYPNISPCESH